MAEIGEDGRIAMESDMCDVFAAMMEELGPARKDTLPLEDKKGIKGHVDLDALDREKKAKAKGSAPNRIVRDNQGAHDAWKNATFDDVDPADLQLDSMNSGQSHRLRMKAELEASSHPRGAYSTRGGRGSQRARGGRSHSSPRKLRNGDRVHIGEVMARLGGRFVPRGMAGGVLTGTPRGGFPKHAKLPEDILAPKPNLSFEDSRSINALPFPKTTTRHKSALSMRQSRQPPQAPKLNRPTNYSQGFLLASPEDFLARSRASSPARITASDEGKNKVLRSEADDGSYKTWTADLDKFVQLPHKSPTSRFPTEGNESIVYAIPVQIAHQVWGINMVIGSGTVHIIADKNNEQVPKRIQVKYQEKILVVESLVEGFEFKVDSCSVSFQTVLEGRVSNWVLTTLQPCDATDLAKTLERSMLDSPAAALADTSTKGHVSELAIIEEIESLISLIDEDPPPETVSQHTEDLVSLWEDQQATVQVKNGIGNTSSILVASDSPVGLSFEVAEAKITKETFRGLATSHFATETDSLSSMSATFKKLSGNTAVQIQEQVSQKLLEETRKNISDERVPENTKQQLHIRYTIEELMSLKYHAGSIRKSSTLDQLPYVSAAEEAQRHTFGLDQVAIRSMAPRIHSQGTTSQADSPTTRRRFAIVSGIKKAQKLPGLASSRYAGLRAEKGQLTDPKSSDSRGPKPFQGRPNSIDPSIHAVRSFQAFVKSQNDDPAAAKSFQELTGPSSAATLESMPLQELNSSKISNPPIAKPFQGLASSKYASPNAAKSITALALRPMPKLSPKKPAVVAKSSHPVIFDFKENKKSQMEIATPVNEVRPHVPPPIMDVTKRKEKDGVATANNFATSVDQSHEDATPAVESWASLRRRESFNSHASKTSTETVLNIFKPIQDHPKPRQSSMILSHQSMFSIDSSVSPESFATAIETSIQGEDCAWQTTTSVLSQDFTCLTMDKQPTSLQNPTSEFLLFPDDVTKPEAVKKDHRIILSYARDMSELIEGSSTSNSPSAVPNATSAANFKPFEIPPLRNPVIPTKCGLMSSRYSTANEDVLVGALKTHPQLMSTTVWKETTKECNTQENTPLKPTASQFTPSVGSSLNTPTTSLINEFPTSIEPVIATVLVNDPIYPGLFREVSGFLKMGSTPIIGFVAADHSPMAQGLASRTASVNEFSPEEAQAPVSGHPLSPLHQKNKNFQEPNEQEVRRNVQQRLRKSLAEPRFSRSPNSGGI